MVDSRDDDLVRLIQDQRSTTRVIVVHTGHPSEQPMAPSEILDLGADTYLAPVSLPGARRPREGVDQIVGRVPAPSRGHGPGDGGRSDRVDDDVGRLDRRPHVDAVVQAEVGDRRLR